MYVRSYCNIPIEFCDSFYGCCTISTILFIDKLYNGETLKSEQFNSFFLHYDIAPGSMITVLKAVRFM